MGRLCGDDSDKLSGSGGIYTLYGDAGNDILNLNTEGSAFGGAGADSYYVYSADTVEIRDDGAAGVNDFIYLKNIAQVADVVWARNANDLYVTSAADAVDGIIDSGVWLPDWFAGNNTIEIFVTGDGGQIPGSIFQ